MSRKTLEIEWADVGTFEALLKEKIYLPSFVSSFSCPGIYFWVEIDGNEEFSNYIGKTNNNLIKRNLEHFSNQIGLQYTIPAKYNAINKRYVPLSKKSERLVGVDGFELIDPIKLNLKDKEIRTERSFNYLKKITLYFAKLNQEQLKDIDKIEKQLITDLRPVENSSSTQTRYDYFDIKHLGELKKDKIDTLIINSKKELQSDHTRPYKFKK